MLTVSSIFKVKLFKEKGYQRRRCLSCGRYFWTLNDDNYCGDQPCVAYTFMDSPPTKLRYNISEVREAFLSFFEKHNHRRVGKYPVRARWRDDVYFVGASIYDFQPWVTEGIIPPPANPLTISQPCIRFTDVDLVGKSGRHLTEFEMMAHHAFNSPKAKIYWTDDTVAYCYEFLTRSMGIKPEAINFVEDMWIGGGNAGEDLEVVVGGIEVATLVFMHYKTDGSKRVPLKNKTVDTGYGLERLVWLSQGTPTVYDAIFEPAIQRLIKLSGHKIPDRAVFTEASKLAGQREAKTTGSLKALRTMVAKKVGVTVDELEKVMAPVEMIYAIADFSRTLVFMLGDGVVPSNAEAGYLARLLVRRILRNFSQLGVEIPLTEILALQLQEISKDYPEYGEKERVIHEMCEVEEKRYKETLLRGSSLVEKLIKEERGKGSETLSEQSLIRLYDSHGLTPDYVSQIAEKLDFTVNIPDDFYGHVAKVHEAIAKTSEEGRGKTESLAKLERRLTSLRPTHLLYYEDVYIQEFSARVLKVLNRKYVVLDRTAFYAEGGGQLGDRGALKWKGGEAKVVDTQKVGRIIVHIIDGKLPKAGQRVEGQLNWSRRLSLMRHHTATHILIGAVHKILGEHAWQSGAFKDVDRARLDVAHYLKLTDSQVVTIEQLANRTVMGNLPVTTEWLPREEAEARYGFSIYQGGVVPGKEIRIVKVGDLDVEACGGAHCGSTGEVGFIKIIRAEHIQDGVERFIFAAGIPALQQAQESERRLRSVAKLLGCPTEKVEQNAEAMVTLAKRGRSEIAKLREKLAKQETPNLLKDARPVGDLKLLSRITDEMDTDAVIKTASELIKVEPKLVTVFIIVDEKATKIVVMAGAEAVEGGVNAGRLASTVAEAAGGRGGGKPNFGQGGSVHPKLAEEALEAVEKSLRDQLGAS